MNSDHMNIVLIIQARVGSTRLPGKVLKDIEGMPMLMRVVNRVRLATLPNSVVVATSTELGDDAVAKLCAENDTVVFRGSELDVLDRYYNAAREFAADVVVRVTSDCPLIDPDILDRVIAAFLESKPDYASNALARTYPRGLDVEAVSMASLTRAWHEAKERYQRVHVTPFIYQNRDRFHCINIAADNDYSSYRWTVDTSADLDFVRTVYARMGRSEPFGWREVIAMLECEPQLTAMNCGVSQKTLEEG